MTPAVRRRKRDAELLRKRGLFIKKVALRALREASAWIFSLGEDYPITRKLDRAIAAGERLIAKENEGGRANKGRPVSGGRVPEHRVAGTPYRRASQEGGRRASGQGGRAARGVTGERLVGEKR